MTKTFTLTIDLPFPPKELNPNRKTHWGTKSRKAKEYRAWCYYLAAHWSNREKFCDFIKTRTMPSEKLKMDLTFFPPDKRKRDDDNMEASFKSGRDGIAEAFGIDDNRFTVSRKISEVVKGGMVRVTIHAEPVCNGL